MHCKSFLGACSRYLLGKSNGQPYYWSWCSWTTFTRLQRDSGYWTAPLPLPNELMEFSTLDGGMWRQPFYYEDIAHIVVPGNYVFERIVDDFPKEFEQEQDIYGLSNFLKNQEIDHILNKYAVEIKLY